MIIFHIGISVCMEYMRIGMVTYENFPSDILQLYEVEFSIRIFSMQDSMQALEFSI